MVASNLVSVEVDADGLATKVSLNEKAAKAYETAKIKKNIAVLQNRIAIAQSHALVRQQRFITDDVDHEELEEQLAIEKQRKQVENNNAGPPLVIQTGA